VHWEFQLSGQGKAGATLEASKDWSKRFMMRHKIPTAAYASFNSAGLEHAIAYVRAHALPVVLKASGLAAGKGVLICDIACEEAEAGLREMLDGSAFGAAGETVVIEEFLTGIELSVFVLDGWQNLESAARGQRLQTHRRRRHWSEYWRYGGGFSRAIR
jgi:phosphoribosylamine--glycine ligase